MSPYTIALHKIDTCCCKKQLESRQRQLGKTAVVKGGAYNVSYRQKDNRNGLEACESHFLKNAYQQ